MSMLSKQGTIINTNVKTFIKRATILILPAVVLWGCESTPEQPMSDTGSAVTTTDTAGATSSAMDQDSGSTAKPMTSSTMNSLDDPNSLLSNRVVYFDFDRNDVKDEFRNVINAHAEYLANNPGAKVTIEGHADERGTREYNIGLGDRRANAVRQLMVLQGASSSQADSISYGEERPADLGHNESSWSKNRRAEIVYSSR